jgi:hypothetical protein
MIPQDPLKVKGKGRPKGATTTVAPTTEKDSAPPQKASQRGLRKASQRDLSKFEHVEAIQVTQATQDDDDEIDVVNVQVHTNKRQGYR